MIIYDFIKENETAFQKPIQLEEGWNWSLKDHLRRSFLYKNSQFLEANENRDLRPNKNIVLGILNVQYRTEGFDVKDIDIYVNDSQNYYKSFLVKKYHDKWALENFIDTFIDDLIESYVDYGGVLVRNTNESRPEVIDLRSLAFCNQTNILAYPFAIKHKFSPSQLREMKNWGGESATIDIESLITLCKDEKEIVIYEVHGNLPGEWIGKEEKDVQQIQCVAFYKKQNGNEEGVILFNHKEPKLPFKFLSRDKIIGRALGRGGVEELFEPQQWTNWSEIKITEMLEAASKTIHITDDPQFKTKQNLNKLDNNAILSLQQGRQFQQVDNYPRNLAVFNDTLERWQIHAQQLGAASEGMLSGEIKSGVPFKLFEAKNIEDKSMHKFRQGQIAVFVDEIYRDWIIPYIAREIANDQKFLTTLSADEMREVGDAILVNQTNKFFVEKVIEGKFETLETDMEAFKEVKRAEFTKTNKKFIEILKDDLKDIPLSIMTNIAGKQKDLALLTDKLVSVVRQFLSTPQLRQDPEMVKLLNVILESSGMSPIMFGASPKPQMQPLPQQAGGGTEALKSLGQAGLQAKAMAMV